MSSTSPIGQTYVAPVNPVVNNGKMTQTDFMKLLITQLANQDPMKPTDSDSMMTQMTQIASIQSMTSMQQGMTRLGIDQQLTLGQQLIGKNIQLQDSQGNAITGHVTKVSLSSSTDSSGAPVSTVNIQVNGNDYPISSLQSVLPDTAP